MHFRQVLPAFSFLAYRVAGIQQLRASPLDCSLQSRYTVFLKSRYNKETKGEVVLGVATVAVRVTVAVEA